MTIVPIILLLLISFEGIFIITYIKDYILYKKTPESSTEELAGAPIVFVISSAVINFFDTLGLGSFAIATIFFRHFKLVTDKKLPGTLNTAFTLPIMMQALLFIIEVKVDILTLVLMIASATLGATIGAGIVAKLDENKVRLYMSLALTLVIILILCKQLNILPKGGDQLGLTGFNLVIGVFGNFVLGVLMTIGVGLYAPCLALVYSLGMNPLVAFPIMMGSCAFLMIPASIRFIKAGAYNRKATLWSALGGVIGVYIAVSFVKSLSLYILTWGIVIILGYTAISMFIASQKSHKQIIIK